MRVLLRFTESLLSLVSVMLTQLPILERNETFLNQDEKPRSLSVPPVPSAVKTFFFKLQCHKQSHLVNLELRGKKLINGTVHPFRLSSKSRIKSVPNLIFVNLSSGTTQSANSVSLNVHLVDGNHTII